MKKNKIPLSKQIEIMEKVKERYLEREKVGTLSSGLCHHVSMVFFDVIFYENRLLYGNNMDFIEKNSFSYFNRKNAIKYFRGREQAFWWDREDHESRILFLDWIIKKLKRKQKIRNFFINLMKI